MSTSTDHIDVSRAGARRGWSSLRSWLLLLFGLLDDEDELVRDGVFQR